MRLILASLFLIMATLSVRAQEPPSVVIILADDYGTAGQVYHRTPNIDALAAQGVSFSRAHGMPNCSPSRGSLLTGLYPFNNGITGNNGTCLDTSLPTVAKDLQAMGYRTAMSGKYHICGNLKNNRTHPREIGFDRYALHASDHRYFDPGVVYDTGEFLKGGFGPEIFAQWSVNFLEGCAGPCFLLHAFNLVHIPLFNPATMQEAGERKYDDMVRLMDDIVGRIIAAAPPNTIFIFLGDNGTSKYFGGEKGTGNSREGSTRIPLAITGEGIEPRLDRRLASITDIYPTILDIVSGQIPVDLDGFSLFGAPREYVAAYSDGKGRMVQRDDGWKILGNPWRVHHLPSDAKEDDPVDPNQNPKGMKSEAGLALTDLRQHWQDIQR